jgi:hypothetical protein
MSNQTKARELGESNNVNVNVIAIHLLIANLARGYA